MIVVPPLGAFCTAEAAAEAVAANAGEAAIAAPRYVRKAALGTACREV